MSDGVREKRNILLTPGPVHVDRERFFSLEEMHHRSDSFRNIMKETCSLVTELAGGPRGVAIVSSSGTGAMEAAVINFTARKEKALVISAGKFGDRWGELLTAFGRSSKVYRLDVEREIDISELVNLVRSESPDTIFLTHVESSTGMLFPLREFMDELTGSVPLVIVDAIASMGAEEICMEDWGIDVIVGASQKALAAPPGVGIVAYGKKAEDRMRRNGGRGYYLDLARYSDEIEKGDPPFTPAVHIVQMILDSLRHLKSLGWGGAIRRHAEISGSFYRGMKALGYETLSRHPSSAVQALKIPTQFAGKMDLPGYIEEKTGFVVAGGQGEFFGKLLRTGFLGIHGGKTIADFLIKMRGVNSGINLGIDEAGLEEAVESLRSIPSVYDSGE